MKRISLVKLSSKKEGFKAFVPILFLPRKAFSGIRGSKAGGWALDGLRATARQTLPRMYLRRMLPLQEIEGQADDRFRGGGEGHHQYSRDVDDVFFITSQR
jgi:hypothetical protein